MPVLTLTKEQVLDLVNQLPADTQEALFQSLVARQWPEWTELARQAQPGARRAAADRGLNWDAMSESEREALVDDLVHEDRACGP